MDMQWVEQEKVFEIETIPICWAESTPVEHSIPEDPFQDPQAAGNDHVTTAN